MAISFVAGQTSGSFGAVGSGGISSYFQVANNEVTFGINTDNHITILFAGGGTVELQGFSEFEANQITKTFSSNGTSTMYFGTEVAIPSFS